MKPFYKDQFVTIYNSPYQETKSDVIVLDPPHFLDNIRDFKADVIFIFAGVYGKQYQDIIGGEFLYWQETITDHLKRIVLKLEDLILTVGITIPQGMITYSLPPIYDRFQQWQRPTRLLLNILALTEGNILDPFMGSGSTAVASKLLKRKFVGYEINKLDCEIAKRRCETI